MSVHLREDVGEYLDDEVRELYESFYRWETWENILRQLPNSPAQLAKAKLVHRSDSWASYEAKVFSAKEQLVAGNIYQVNLSQQFIVESQAHPYEVFWQLMRKNPASFCAYFSWYDFAIVSSSPERLLSCSSGLLETRPIKGTSPRFQDPDRDRASKEALLSSEKERAELLMITDLMRNDLGRISQAGSVKTDRLWQLEAYENVYHMYSRIKSCLREGLSPWDALRSCFPGGSITGCPKLRAMQIIHSLEKRARNIYTGSLGYLAGNGDFDWNIAIRTMLCRKGLYDIQLGGGAIVLASAPRLEYEETFHKGRSLFEVFQLQESLEKCP
jgi:para-aminobenzoate synthetase component 1